MTGIAAGIAQMFSRERTITELESELEAKERQIQEITNRYLELRHRIGNNLQALSTLLSAQSRVADQPQFCNRCILRVSSLAELHNALDGELETVSMSDYLRALSRAFGKTFDGRVSIETAVEPAADLDHRRAQCVGLVYAEAAMNALKHAFPADATGLIEARFRRSRYAFELTVSDNGAGFDPDSVQPRHGISLMNELAGQLQGALRLERPSVGTTVRLTFPA